MTIANRPGMRFDFTPDLDYEGIPPILKIRYLSGLEYADVLDLGKSMDSVEEGDVRGYVGICGDILKISLDGWVIDGVDFDPNIIVKTLSINELKQAVAATINQTPDMSDKKKSNSQSHSSTADSAKARVKGRKRAKTNHRK